ncbi:MAG: GNAT family N-acetyltransferase [Clostridium sp.]|nr:GNAT family N-acetyltransferase [Clostridium sp.]
MNISIKEISKDNINIVKSMRVKPEQETFIETVEECLEEASLYKEWHPVAIYYNGNIVGFAMYGCFGPNRHTWIDRILIDGRYQGMGIGKAAMTKLIDIVLREYQVDTIYLSLVKENNIAKKLYKSIGFQDMNEIDPNNGELMFKYKL